MKKLLDKIEESFGTEFKSKVVKALNESIKVLSYAVSVLVLCGVVCVLLFALFMEKPWLLLLLIPLGVLGFVSVFFNSLCEEMDERKYRW